MRDFVKRDFHREPFETLINYWKNSLKIIKWIHSMDEFEDIK